MRYVSRAQGMVSGLHPAAALGFVTRENKFAGSRTVRSRLDWCNMASDLRPSQLNCTTLLAPARTDPPVRSLASCPVLLGPRTA